MGEKKAEAKDFHEEDLRQAKEQLSIPRKRFQGPTKLRPANGRSIHEAYKGDAPLADGRRSRATPLVILALLLAAVGGAALVRDYGGVIWPGPESSKLQFGQSVIFFKAEDVRDRRGDAGPSGIGFAKIGDLARVVEDDSGKGGPDRPVVVSIRDGNAQGWEGEVPRSSLRPHSGK